MPRPASNLGDFRGPHGHRIVMSKPVMGVWGGLWITNVKTKVQTEIRVSDCCAHLGELVFPGGGVRIR